MIAVSDDHSKLRSLGNILMELEETKPLGQDIIKDYDEMINRSVTTAVVTGTTVNTNLFSNQSTELAVPRAHTDIAVISTSNATGSIGSVEVFHMCEAVHQYPFDAMRGKFGIFRFRILQIVSEKVSILITFLIFLRQCFPELDSQLSSADSVQNAMTIVLTKCNVINISAVENIAIFYNISEAKQLIVEYKEEVNEFCSKISLDFLLNKKLSADISSLKCETVQFVLDWTPDQHSLDDIRRLLKKAFTDLNKRLIVKVTCPVNSIVIICYAPHHLLAALLFEAQDNLTVLIKEFTLVRLTIGHYTVYDERIRCKVMNNECLVEEMKLADGQELELMTLLDYKGSITIEQESVINQREEHIERTLQTPEPKLKVKLLTRGKLINEVFKSKKSETQYFRTSLLMKAGREEALFQYRKEIELLQENISITQLLISQKTNMYKNDQCTQSSTAESTCIYTARYDYHPIDSDDLSFTKGEQLEIYKKLNSFWWRGRSLASGVDGLIPSSCVYSMLETLQLLEFILSVEEVSLPVLQKLRNESSSNDEKASLFLETINDDPIVIFALRQDKEQYDQGVTGSVNWYYDWLSLTSPSPVQCSEVISIISNFHKRIELRYSSTNSTVSLLSSATLQTLHLRSFDIWYTPLTNDCIQYLCILLTNNKTIQELDIRYDSISDRGVINICQTLENNSTLISLDLSYNPLITSTSGQALSHLLRAVARNSK